MPRPHACLIAYSPIADDPRVRRMGDALTAKGWDVVGVGLPGAISPPPNWTVLEAMGPETPNNNAELEAGPLASIERFAGNSLSVGLKPIEYLLKKRGGAYVAHIEAARRALMQSERPIRQGVSAAGRQASQYLREWSLSPEEKFKKKFWRLSQHLGAMRDLVLTVKGPTMWIANDWWALPAAVAGLDKEGGALAYDSHELASEEYSERPDWVRHQKPIVDAIESRCIKRAAVVTSVSPGITDHLRRNYQLTVPTMTLRNTPVYQSIPFRPVGQDISVLYHGVVAPGRGLEAAIMSVAQWRQEFSLHIRGPATDQFADKLRKIAESAHVANRVIFHPPVPMMELVQSATAFDLGIMALPAHSLQNTHALPNKLFEYLMAGLALVVTDLPEMKRLVEETNAGLVMRDATPDAIAETINSVTPSSLDVMRRAALEAAKIYNWENEAPPVIELYDKTLREHENTGAQ